MRKMHITFAALIFLIANYAVCSADTPVDMIKPKVKKETSDLYPVKTIPKVRGEAWKTAGRFEISKIEGLQGTYNTEEQIEFLVEGKSEKMFIEEENGFNVSATIYDRTKRTGHRADRAGISAKVEYVLSSRAWQVKLTAPKDNHDKFTVVVSLYCKKMDSPCATTFGYGTQVNKSIPLKVHSIKASEQ